MFREVAWIAKYSTAGARQWEMQIDVPALTNPLVYFLRQTADGGFLVGIGWPQVITPFVSILVKLNSTGVLQWSKSFGQSPDNLRLNATQDGGIIAMHGASVTLTKMDSSASIQWDKHYDPLPGFYTWGYDVTEGSDGSFYVVGNYSCDGATNNGLFVMKVSSTGDSCTVVTPNTTPEDTTNVTVSSFPAASETSSPNTTLAGEFTLSNSSSTATPICTGQLVGGQWVNISFSNYACSGIQFDILDMDCGTNQACINERKVLISNKGPENYPSTYQQDVSSGGNPEKDRKIKITGNTMPFTDLWLRVDDPDDPSPYEVDLIENDNQDKSGDWQNGASLSDTHVVSDSNGDFETIMTITDRYSGDNYQVEGSIDPAFSCDPTCSKTGILTAWKRVYIEQDRMYRKVVCYSVIILEPVQATVTKYICITGTMFNLAIRY